MNRFNRGFWNDALRRLFKEAEPTEQEGISIALARSRGF